MMARLSSERLRMHITDVIHWEMSDGEVMYESFKIRLTIHGREAIAGVNGDYELVEGNIEGLIATIDEALEKKSLVNEIEFCEPDFNFEIKWKGDWVHPFTHEVVSDDYELICWVNSGNWNGIYSSTEIGCKFHIKEHELIKFRDGLQYEFDNRKFLKYR